MRIEKEWAELWRGQFLGLRFEWYTRDHAAAVRKPWRLASKFCRKPITCYWFSLWTPTRSLRVFPATMEWSHRDRV